MRDYCLILFPMVLLFSCANPVTPAGGPKDEQPPILLQVNPTDRSVNTTPKKIYFLFDENIQLKNAQEEIIISPKPKIKARILQERKSIVLSIPENALDANTTYSINLNQAVTDLNEGNQGQYPPVLFSTGPILDTMQLSGTYSFVKEPKTKKIQFHFILPGQKNYQLASITEKKYLFSGISATSGHIIAFNDLNSNDTADANEDIGLVTASYTDSPMVLIYDNSKNNITVFETGSQNIITGLKLQDQQILLNTYKAYYKFKDSIFTDDTSTFDIIKNINHKYYIKSSKKYPYQIKPKGFFTQPSLSSDSTLYAYYQANLNISSYVPQIKSLMADSQINITYNYDRTNTLRINYQHTGKYKNYIRLVDSTGNTLINDSNQLSITSYQPLVLRNTDTVQITYLLTDKSNQHNKIFGSFAPGTTETFYALPGSYQLEAWDDTDADRHVTSPDLLKMTEGETYKKWTNITVNEKMVIEYAVSVHK